MGVFSGHVSLLFYIILITYNYHRVTYYANINLNKIETEIKSILIFDKIKLLCVPTKNLLFFFLVSLTTTHY